jgi:hypothetical protein
MDGRHEIKPPLVRRKVAIMNILQGGQRVGLGLVLTGTVVSTLLGGPAGPRVQAASLPLYAAQTFSSSRTGLAGYVTAQDGKQHVVLVGADSHVHEFWWAFAAPGWHNTDLTLAAEAPNATSTKLVGYVSAQDGKQHVIFASADGHVHELWWAFAAPGWHNTDLTLAAGAPPAAASMGLAGYVSAQDGKQHIIFEGIDSHVHELWWAFAAPGWHDSDLTLATGAPNATVFNGLAGYISAQDGKQHIIFEGTDSHVHELWWAFAAPGWHNTDLTLAAGAPNATVFNGLVGYVSAQDGKQHDLFVDTNRHVHELWWAFAAPGWHDTDLSLAAV